MVQKEKSKLPPQPSYQRSDFILMQGKNGSQHIKTKSKRKKKTRGRDRLSPNTNTICLTEPFTLRLATTGTQGASRNQPTKPVTRGQSLGQFVKTEAGLPYEESFRGEARVQFL